MSKNYECKKCEARFVTSRDLRRHENRKDSCNPWFDKEDVKEQGDDDYQCKHCGKGFKHTSAMYRHSALSCKMRPGEEAERLKAIYKAHEEKTKMDEIRKEVKKEMEAERDEQDKKMKDMEKQIQELKQSIQNTPHPQSVAYSASATSGPAAVATTGGTVNQKVDQRMQIQLNVFGQETFDHISQEEMAHTLIEASRELSKIGPGDASKNYVHLHAAASALQNIMGMIYANRRAPRNATCYLKNKKGTTVEVHGLKGWEKKPLGIVGPIMKQRAMDAAFDRQPRAGVAADRCAAILSVIRGNEEKLRNDQSCLSVRAILEQVKELLENLPAEDEELPPPPIFELDEIKQPRLTKRQQEEQEIDEIFEELYGRSRNPRPPPKPKRPLALTTIEDAFQAMKSCGLLTSEEPTGDQKEWALKAAEICVKKAQPWDRESEREAWGEVDKLFWELSKEARLDDAAKQRAKSISGWCQSKAYESDA